MDRTSDRGVADRTSDRSVADRTSDRGVADRTSDRGVADRTSDRGVADRTSDRGVARWLPACCGLIFCMVVLGGVTRLTRSGLSIVEWQPIMGALPPLSHDAWLETFHKYQQTPEYKTVNLGMGLEEFKSIFLVEYAHRLLGRTIGLAFLVPFLYFAATGRIHRRLQPKLAGIFALGGLQGVLGWYMVKSGLIDVPRVSPYRLTAHLAMGFLLYASILWVALGLLARGEESAPHPLRRSALAVTGLVSLMVLAGGFVAGLKAGLAYNTFPTMNGQWIPAGLFALEPAWVNFFENTTTAQFDHRLLAWALAVAIPAFWWRARGTALSPGLRRAVNLLPVLLAVQVGLGIATLLLFVPVALAAAHQAAALALFTVALVVTHGMGGSRR
jgi:cytochrome c oxidase assembly protein subunit 15